MNLPATFFSVSENDTKKISKSFANELKLQDIVVLKGELGAGKTFFIKHTLAKLGVDKVTSPSFSIVNEYSGDYKFYHFDFYRLKNIEELFDIGWQDYLNEEDAIIFIEWGDMFPEILPSKKINIHIKVNGNKRELQINKND